MKCPNCRLENPPEAERCDCGYDFPSGSVKTSFSVAALKSELPPKDIVELARAFRKLLLATTLFVLMMLIGIVIQCLAGTHHAVNGAVLLVFLAFLALQVWAVWCVAACLRAYITFSLYVLLFFSPFSWLILVLLHNRARNILKRSGLRVSIYGVPEKDLKLWASSHGCSV